MPCRPRARFSEKAQLGGACERLFQIVSARCDRAGAPRRVKENGSLGTDHGAALQMFVLTPDRGGLYGEHASFTELDDGDLKFHTNFRSVDATLLEKCLGLASELVLGGKYRPLDFVA